jgi:hypothetical protein
VSGGDSAAEISPSAKSFINDLLNPDPTARYTFAKNQAKGHVWFDSHDGGNGVDWAAIKHGTLPAPHAKDCQAVVQDITKQGSSLAITPYGDEDASGTEALDSF